MLIDVVDDRDEVIGTIDRSEALSASVNFRVAHVFVFNNDGVLLVQQIPIGKRHAGFWGSSMAGYVYAGETYQQAAKRRLDEELGIQQDLRFCTKTTLREGVGTKFISLFETTYTGKVKFNRNEVAAIEFINMDLVEHLVDSGIRQFTPTFLHLVKVFRSRR